MSDPRDTAIVLVSGGMDSCVTAAIASQVHDVAFVHFMYGQRTERKEAECFAALADAFGVPRRLVVRLDHMRSIGGSSLTDPSIPVPEGDLARAEIPMTYVPFRNAQMLSVAAAWAEAIGARAIYIGAVEEDSSGYPDCRRAFFDLYEKAIDAGTRPETSVRIETPVIHMRKSDIVRRGLELRAPFHLTWSCYRSEDLACGTCDSCLLRLRAFEAAGHPDPIRYRPEPRRTG
jgi:7-cyano-7-deazaguanine synthase